jgi:hypothetical protein
MLIIYMHLPMIEGVWACPVMVWTERVIVGVVQRVRGAVGGTVT